MTPLDYLIFTAALAYGFGAAGWAVRRFDLRRPNFRKERIPAVMGLAFVLFGVFFYTAEWITQRRVPGGDPVPAGVYGLVTLGFGVLGLFDDILGSRAVGGFRGHFRELLRGGLTTGAAKALGGGFLGLAAGWLLAPDGSWPRCVLGAALIALSANALNLLDLRPGRCLFGFLFSAGLIALSLVLRGHGPVGLLLYAAMGVALILYPLDAGGRAMIGDTGSNAFGAVLGVAAVLYFSWPIQAVLVAGLLLFHFWAETHSLTQTIEETPWLRWIDRKIGLRG